MPDFGIFRGFGSKLFSDKLYAGQLPTQLGLIGSESFGYLYLLDDYPNAAAAYSLRKLRKLYTGNAIRVRRSTDNAEQDIGFVNNVLDTSALTTFCGGSNGFVTTWYDQSDNVKNASQTTATNQPQIVSNGNVILNNGKPSIEFLNRNMNYVLNIGDLSALTVGELFLTIKSYSDGAEGENGFLKFGTDTQSNHYPFSDGNIYDGFGSNSRKSTGNPTTNLKNLNLYNVLSKSNLWQSRINNTLHYTDSSNAVSFSNNAAIGQPNKGFQGFMSELILYPSDQSSNRTGISTNINTYYVIY